MLHLYKSHDVNQLANKYLEVNKNIAKPLLKTQPLIVSTMAIGRWLIQQIAQKQGVCANIERLLPGAYLWRLIGQMDSNLPARYELNKEILVLRILALLDDEDFIQNHPRLSQYLYHCCSADKVALSKKISKVFDHYQLYRKDWLAQWETGKTVSSDTLDLGEDESWQQALWQKLLEGADNEHRMILEDKLLDMLNGQPKKMDLPQSLCLFGITTLPLAFIPILNSLAKQCEVHIFAFAYGDKQTLLPHWKNSERNFYTQFDVTAEVLNQRQAPQNQLQVFQHALMDESYAHLTTNPAHFTNPDQSILSVSCYTAMREVEALHEYLVNLFASQPQLEPADILVAMPDLDSYTPYIRAVFDGGQLNNSSNNRCDNKPSDKKIPYTLCDNLAATESVLVNGITELLSLPQWRFTLEQVMTLLRNRFIQKKFQINDTDIDLIETWLEDAGVRWAVDAKHWQELGLPYKDSDQGEMLQNTWRMGLDRLLLGFALANDLSQSTADGIPLYHDVLPVDDIEGSGCELLSRFSDYCDTLFKWKKVLSKRYSMQQWQLKLQALVGDFFVLDNSEEKTKDKFLKAIDQMAKDAKQVAYENKMDVQGVGVLLVDAMASNASGIRFGGSVNIASMNSLAGFPFKHLCLIGLNYDAWPNQQREPGFDLMQKQPRSGDRNQSDMDRYTTLQLILSAKESLYLSYTGQSIHNGEEIPPSVLLSELLDASKKLGLSIHPIHHPMHVYSPKNFDKNSPLQSSNAQWLETAKKIATGRSELPVLCDSPLLSKPSTIPQSLDSSIDVDDLCRFFQNPQSHFLRHALGIYIRDDSKEWHNTEPFNLGNFVDSQVRQMAFACSQTLGNATNNSTNNASYAMSRASGILPHGEYGKILHQVEQEKVDNFVDTLAPEFSTAVLPPLPVNTEIPLATGTIRLIGSLRNLRPEGLLISQVDDLYLYQKIQYWLQHLLLCAVQPEAIACNTQIQYLDNGFLQFNQPEHAKEILAQWLSAYLIGQKQPLTFFDKTSWAYATSFYKKGGRVDSMTGSSDGAKQSSDIAQAQEKIHLTSLKEARKKWHDNYQYKGQNAKPANLYIYRGQEPLGKDFQQWATTLLIPLLEHEQQEQQVKI